MKQRITFALIMGVITTALISFALAVLNFGLHDGFLMVWLRSWGLSYVLAVLTIFFISPSIQRMVSGLLRKDRVDGNGKFQVRK